MSHCVLKALERKAEEKEPGYLCSLPALPHTLSGRRKGSFNGPGMGRESPFHTWLVGNFSSILCMPFAYDPFFFPKVSVREESMERSQNSSSPPTAQPFQGCSIVSDSLTLASLMLPCVCGVSALLSTAFKLMSW